ncbi:MAG: hypothetical protein K8R92_02960 [Planctomycetes bacterium]|nr:hypothetical protein [Planctomycetota bacterium]
MKFPRRGALRVSLAALFPLLLLHCTGAQVAPGFFGTPVKPEQDGLEVIRWTTTDESSRLEGVVIGFQKRPVMNPLASEQLQREGFLAAIVSLQDVPALQARIGSGSMDIRTSYGTMPNWRDVFQRELPDGLAFSVNGRAQTSRAQVMQIAARGWTTPTESGGCFQLELVTTIVPSALVQEGRMARADRPLGTPIANTGIETCLEPDEALILLSANQGPFKSGRGPGAEAPLPPTAGRFLLGESADLEGKETPMKGFTLLAFLPHVPGSIQPVKKSDDSN